MKRLFIKEWREDRPYLFGLLALVAVFVLIGDPLAFRGGPLLQDILPGLFGVPLLLIGFAGFLMGLSAYSRELAGGTLPFALSCPVRWGWLLVVKLLAGVGVCLLVALAAAVLYAIRVPALYRPFLDPSSLGLGAAVLLATALFGFLVGLGFSSLVPGVALSFAVAVGVFALFMTFVDILERLYPTSEAFLYAGLAVGLVASVRSPAVLQPRRRIGAWIAGFAAGMALVAVWGLGQRALGNGAVVAKPASSWVASPDGQRVFYWSYTHGGPAPGDVWVRDTQGVIHHVDTAKRANFIAWSEDGSTAYYAAGPNGRVTLRSASARDGWRPRTVAVLPIPAKNAPDARAYIETYMDRADAVKWSPSEDRLALDVSVWPTESTSVESLVVVDVANGRAARVYEGSPRGFWWIDNARLGVLTKEMVVKTVPAMSRTR